MYKNEFFSKELKIKDFYELKDYKKQLSESQLSKVSEIFFDCIYYKKQDILKNNMDKLFILNSKIEDIKEEFTIDMISYNIGLIEMTSQIISNIYNKLKEENDIYFLEKYSNRFKQIIDILYEYKSLSHSDLANNLNITRQNLYNIIHNNNDNSILRISRSQNRKAVYYSLTIDGRNKYKNYKNKTQYNLIKKDKFRMIDIYDEDYLPIVNKKDEIKWKTLVNTGDEFYDK